MRLFELSQEQEEAKQQVMEFVNSDLQYLTLGGFAGTGKTTLVFDILEELERMGLLVVVLTPTGKAAHVLRMKGVDAATIHSFLYFFRGTVITDDDKEKLIFDEKEVLEKAPDLVIVDESSMVTTDIVESMSAHGLKILWIGDHGQLPPVGRDPGLMKNLDVRLETIFRQSLDNPILGLSHMVRQGGIPRDFPREQWGDSLKIGRCGGVSEMAAYMARHQINQAIVPFNNFRHGFNAAFRKEQLGYESVLEEGDKLICLKNDYRRSMYNGMMFMVDEVIDVDEERDLVVANMSDPDSGAERTGVKIHLPTLQGKEVRFDEIPTGYGQFNYGYAITCHKAQGSEWDSVLVVDMHCRNWDMKRWRYTAFTRAKKELHVAVGR